MPRSRRRLNPRELAREAARRGGRMRSWSGGRPDIVPVLVEERLEDGRYKVRRDHWPCSIYVPVTPAGSEIPTPSRQRLLFESGNPQLPFLLWRKSASGAVFVDGLETEAASTQDWICWGASFSRCWSWTAAEFNAESATTLGAVPTLNPRLNLRIEDHQREEGQSPSLGSYAEGSYRGGHNVHEEFPAVAIVGPSGFNRQQELLAAIEAHEEDLEDPAIPSSVRILATALSDGVLYVDCEATVAIYTAPEDPEEEPEWQSDDLVGWIVAVRISSGDAAQIYWVQRTYRSDAYADPPRLSDTIVTPTVCAVLRLSEEGDWEVGRYNRFTGSPLATIVYDDEDAWQPWGEQLPGDRFEVGYRPVFARGERLYLAEREYGRIACVDLAAGVIAWKTAKSAGRKKQIVALTESSLLCSYDEVLTTTYLDQGITNNVAGESWDITTYSRTDRAAGHSRLRGLVALSLETGAEIGSSLFAGTEADGTVEGNREAQVSTWSRDHVLVPKSTLAYYGSIPPEDPPTWHYVAIEQPQLTAWNAFTIPRYNNFWIGLHQPPDPDPVLEETVPWPRLPILEVGAQTYRPESQTAPEAQADRDWLEYLVGQGPSAEPAGGGTLASHREAEWQILNDVRKETAEGWEPISESVRVTWPNSRGVRDVGDAEFNSTSPVGATDLLPWDHLSYTDTRTISDNAPAHYQQIHWLGGRRLQGPLPTPENPVDPGYDFLQWDRRWPKVPNRFWPTAVPDVFAQPWFDEVEIGNSSQQRYVSKIDASSNTHEWRAEAGEALQIQRKFCFRRSPQLPALATPLPDHTLGPCPSTGDLAVLPPRPRYGGETHDIRWRCVGATAATVWERVLSVAGTVEVGPTIITGSGIHTFLRIGADSPHGTCVTLALEDGEILSQEECPLTLVHDGAIFDGYRSQFVSIDGQTRWGAPD